jgi:hypothetical protein
MSEPTLSFKRVATLDLPDYGEDFCIVGTRVYLATGSAGLLILDIAEPARPRIIGSYTTPDRAIKVSVAGDLIAVAVRNHGVLFVDARNAAQPTLVGHYPMTTTLQLHATATRLYVTGASEVLGFQIIDISDPTTPTLRAVFDRPGECEPYAFALSNEYVYVTGDTNPYYPQPVIGVVQVIDEQEFILHQTIVGSPSQGVGRIVWHRQQVYINTFHKYGAWAIGIYDVSLPHQLVGLGAYSTLIAYDGLSSLTFIDDLLCISVGNTYETGARLFVVDISDPQAPVQLPQYAPFTFDFSTSALVVRGDYVYASEQRRFTVLERPLPYKLRLPLVSVPQGDR